MKIELSIGSFYSVVRTQSDICEFWHGERPGDKISWPSFHVQARGPSFGEELARALALVDGSFEVRRLEKL